MADITIIKPGITRSLAKRGRAGKALRAAR
jgi:hypothetical protein